MVRLGTMFVLTAFLSGGCGPLHLGGVTKPSGESRHKVEVPPADQPAPPVEDGSAPDQVRQILSTERDIPIETFLTTWGREVPARIRATSLRFDFRANVRGARFECRSSAQVAFEPCSQGNAAIFSRLRHGQQVALWVRARSLEGRVDLTPLQIGFVVDLVSGVIPEDWAADVVDEQPLLNVADVPLESTSGGVELDSFGKPLQRQLQVGSWYAVAVPWSMYLASWSSTKTWNGGIHSLRILGRPSSREDERCDRTFERSVPGPRGTTYCEGTSTRVQSAEEFARPLPWNHAELVSAAGDERLFASAFDSDTDPAAQGWWLSQICSGAAQAGRSRVQLLSEFYGVIPREETLVWCQMRDSSGGWWWTGIFDAKLGEARRMQVVYALRAGGVMSSGEQFAARMSEIIPRIVVPIAPTQ
jgi:hypothetical protein